MFGEFLNRDDLIRKAEAVRKRKLGGRPARSLQDAYTVVFWLAKRLHRRYPDTRIMVGDDSHGRLHHWIEIPSLKTYVDPAHDASEDSGPAVLAGSTEEPFYTESYGNVLDSNFNVEEARHQPKYVYSPDTAESMYKD